MRVLLTGRWLGLTALALLTAVGCVLAGLWQWQRTQDLIAAERAAALAPIDVTQVAPLQPPLPAESIGRQVDLTGSFDADADLFVNSRALGKQVGFWVVAPLRLADGTRIAVLRGWTPTAAAAAAPDPVRIVGVLSPEEQFYSGTGPVRPGDTVVAMSREVLVAAWGEPLRAGIVFLASAEPVGVNQPMPVPATVAVDVPFPLQNFFYAFQWWVFAAFAAFMWFRWLRLDIRAARAGETMAPSDA